LLKSIEELCELARAISRTLEDDKSDVCSDNLAEEVADVYIVLEYVKKQVPEEMLLMAKKKKLERLRKRLIAIEKTNNDN
jgi:NTP pyrophosphatase (non-canonical NTP hydrolase)